MKKEHKKPPVLLYREQTPYQKIELQELYDGAIALTLDNAFQFVSGLDEELYHGVLAGRPAQMLDKPTDVLVLGGGDGLVARNLVEFPEVRSVTMVELDPGMVRFATDHPIMRAINRDVMRNPKMNVKTMSAQDFLASTPNTYGMAVVDFPDPIQPVHQGLYTRKFYESLYKKMSGNPIISIQSSTAGGPVERSVMSNLGAATHTPSFPLRFFGVWMGDGSVVLGGPGVKPSMATIPSVLRGEGLTAGKKGGIYAGVF